MSDAGPTRRAESTNVFERVEALARDLWWTWNPDAQRLFAALDPAGWEASRHSPLVTLARMPAHRRERVAADRDLEALLRSCERQRAAYGRARPWFSRAASRAGRGLLVAYFCAEFAIHESIPQYSGGLGVLAGDHLKAASDLGVPLVGVGLFYRRGFYEQSLSRDGSTVVSHPYVDPAELPLRDAGARVDVPIGRRRVAARVWAAQIGRTRLLLLDTDLRANAPRDREITAQLYGGDATTRIRQEIVLGVGGVRALADLGLRPTVYHLNEGHAAFCGLERLRALRAGGFSIARAIERVRRSTVFTTHTPVPAGHDRFDPRTLLRHLAALRAQIGMNDRELLALGRENPDDPREPFCMTVLALRLSARCNGVSRLHGEVSRRMWMRVFGAKSPKEVPIGHVTNGVHSATWLAPEAGEMYRRRLGAPPGGLGSTPQADPWRRAARIPPRELWELRCRLRRGLIHFVRDRLAMQARRRGAGPAEAAEAFAALDERALTIGFARRFATYKRAGLIFHDLDRLGRMLASARRPVQIVFAGKAHPRDLGGQELLRRVFRWSRRPELRGRVVLLEEYDMHVARMLVAGCDVWLNNPVRPLEASGTSGMKPPLHGGVNCSILDGWWPEAYNGRNGWAIDGDRSARRAEAAADLESRLSDRARDRRDAGRLYDLIEREIAPLFHRRGRDGVPRGWVARMIASMKSVCATFSAARMVGDYVREGYLPAHAAGRGARR